MQILKDGRAVRSKIERLAFMDDNNYTCFYCGLQSTKPKNSDEENRLLLDFKLDHFIPFFRSNSNDIENIRLACNNCNHKKSFKMPHEFMPERFSINDEDLFHFPSSSAILPR
jgi:5-methylcytosine-specific restriction endonuclease McrA